jgi:hypothetical protein
VTLSRMVVSFVTITGALAAFTIGVHVLTNSSSPEVAGAVITAASTIVITAMTLAVGRYVEKKKELESLHREKKIPIYGEFLTGVFNTFYGVKTTKSSDTVAFLRKWQTNIVIWGGADVVNAYLRWKDALTTTEPSAETMRITNALVLAIRKELGHDDSRLQSDLFPKFILRNYTLYAKEAKKNPNVTLSAITEMESKADETKQ